MCLKLQIYESGEIENPSLQDAIGKLARSRLHSQTEVLDCHVPEGFPMDQPGDQDDDPSQIDGLNDGLHRTHDAGQIQIEHETITIESGDPSSRLGGRGIQSQFPEPVVQNNGMPTFEEYLKTVDDPQILTQKNTLVDVGLFGVGSSQTAPDNLFQIRPKQKQLKTPKVSGGNVTSIKVNSSQCVSQNNLLNQTSRKEPSVVNPTPNFNEVNIQMNPKSGNELFRGIPHQSVSQKYSKMNQASQSESFRLSQKNLINRPKKVVQNNLKTNQNNQIQVPSTQNTCQKKLLIEKNGQPGFFPSLNIKETQTHKGDQTDIFTVYPVQNLILKKPHVNKKQSCDFSNVPSSLVTNFTSQTMSKTQSNLSKVQNNESITAKNAQSQPRDPFQFFDTESTQDLTQLLTPGADSTRDKDNLRQRLVDQNKRDFFEAPAMSQMSQKELPKTPSRKKVIYKSNRPTSKPTLNSMNFFENVNQETQNTESIDLTESLTQNRGISLAHSPQSDLFENQCGRHYESQIPCVGTQPFLSSPQERVDATANGGTLNCEQLYDQFFGTSKVPNSGQQ